MQHVFELFISKYYVRLSWTKWVIKCQNEDGSGGKNIKQIKKNNNTDFAPSIEKWTNFDTFYSILFNLQPSVIY